MAFDLNKNNGVNSRTELASETKNKSNFDLSKNGTTNVVSPSVSVKSNKWIYAAIGILLIGVGAWYFISHQQSLVSTAAEVNDRANGSSILSDGNAPLSTIVDAEKGTAVNDINATSPKLDSVNHSTAATQSAPSVEEDKTTTSSNSVVSKTSLDNAVAASFIKGSNALSNIDKNILKDLISYLTDNPSSIVKVFGYASSEGGLAANQAISQTRAEAFKDLIISNNIAETRITALGMGIKNPIASNQTEAGRKRNRRVEIKLQ